MATALGTKAKDTFAVLSLLGLLAVSAPISTVKADNLPDQSASQTAVSQVSMAFWRSVLKTPPKCRQRRMSRRPCLNSMSRHICMAGNPAV